MQYIKDWFRGIVSSDVSIRFLDSSLTFLVRN